MTRKCPTCGGDGIVYSEASAALDVERRLRALAAGSRAQAFRVELADPIASALVGPGARRLIELEALTKKRFFLEGKPETHLDHFVVLSEGKLADLAPPAPIGEEAETMLQLVEVDRYDAAAAVGKLDGLDVVVADAASLVGKRLKVRVERVLDGRAYAVPVRKTKEAPEPLTAEGEAEKPTRKPPARKGSAPARGAEAAEVDEPVVDEPEVDEDAEIEDASEETAEVEATPAPKKKTRRGSRGGRKRKKPTTAQTSDAAEAESAAEDARAESSEPPRAVTIHVPGDDLGRDGAAEQTQREATEAEASEPQAADEPVTAEAAEADADAAPKPKKKTRRGSRGGRNRKKKPASASENGREPAETNEQPESAEQPAEAALGNGDFEYVPMSEWADELDTNR
jgi:hypothetical protein